MVGRGFSLSARSCRVATMVGRGFSLSSGFEAGHQAGLSRTRDGTSSGQNGGQTNGTFKAELQHVLATDDGCVAGIHHNTGEGNDKPLDLSCCIVFEIKDGQMVSDRESFHDLDALDDFWAEPDVAQPGWT